MSERKGLYERLREYARTDYYPMHMPGHKRNMDLFAEDLPFSLDITEIDGFDNLHLPEGILKEAMERAARVFGAEQTYFLVNGSTCGLLAGISACANPGDRILVARNCHKAVYNAVYLRELRPVYLYPKEVPEFGICGSIEPNQVREALRQYPDVKLIVITSPTYEGVLSDVEEIARIAHEAGAFLLVDEAHGTHLGFGHGFPESAVRLGADIVVQSVHKTLPSPTQTALLHICGRNCRTINSRVKRFLSIYQSSSPSYLLMAGIDRCVEMLEQRGEELFEAWRTRLDWFYREAGKLRAIKVLREDEVSPRNADCCVKEVTSVTEEKEKQGRIFAFDPSKLVLSVRGTGQSGEWLYERLLKDYHIQPEMASGDYAICMTGAGDTQEGMERLAAALRGVDEVLEPYRKPGSDEMCVVEGRFDKVFFREKESLSELFRCAEPEYYSWEMPEIGQETERLILKECEGRVSVEYIYLYPPGIPIVAPGERLTKELIVKLLEYRQRGLLLRGMEDTGGEYLNVRRSVISAGR